MSSDTYGAMDDAYINLDDFKQGCYLYCGRCGSPETVIISIEHSYEYFLMDRIIHKYECSKCRTITETTKYEYPSLR